MRTRFGLFVFAFIGVLFLAIFFFVGKERKNHEVEREFAKILKELPEGEIVLEDVLPFEWDTLYFASPYADEKAIEAEIGVKRFSGFVSEGGMSFLFQSKNRSVLQVSGYPSNLGFDFRYGNFPAKLKTRLESKLVAFDFRYGNFPAKLGNRLESKLVAKIAYGDRVKFSLKKEGDIVIVERVSSVPTLEKAFSMREDALLEGLKGVSEEELFGEWGEFNSPFSGMYGYIWNREGKNIGVYFDFEKKVVVDVKMFE